MPEAVGRGLGFFFLNQSIALAWANPISKLLVNTCTLDHPRALPLYQRAGFEPYPREDRYSELPGGPPHKPAKPVPFRSRTGHTPAATRPGSLKDGHDGRDAGRFASAVRPSPRTDLSLHHREVGTLLLLWGARDRGPLLVHLPARASPRTDLSLHHRDEGTLLLLWEARD